MENIELVDDSGKIIYENIIKKYSWIVAENQKCILSPDSDGFLCGLLMTAMFNWKVAGYYDGKILALEKGENVKNCVFLDMEIFRNYVRSLGQHIVLWNKKNIPANWSNFDNCISPNNIRGYDGKNHFPKKYPLGSIHLLLGIVGGVKKIEIKKEAICPLLYTDGTFKNLFNFPENCISWLDFLCAEDEKSPLKTVFFNDHYTTYSLMFALKDFFEKLKTIGKSADKLKISDSNGNINLENNNNVFSVAKSQMEITDKFLVMLSELTGWKYDKSKWLFDNFSIFKFTKGTTKPNNRNYNELIAKNPLSLAMTSGLAIEHTLEEPDKIAQ
ncbi:hypothetical protein FACS1894178_1330 [Bacteroidia bacterium]|nr:hypothetical protein FACS1894178_1330 [Bacteroidia bacterium]